MANLRASGAYRQGKTEHVFDIEVVSYTDEGVHYMVAPALDVVGAGETEEQAKESFEIVLEEFIKYTSHKRTIQVELKRLGWTLTSGRKKATSYQVPQLQSFANNPDYAAILNKNPTVKNHKVALPL